MLDYPDDNLGEAGIFVSRWIGKPSKSVPAALASRLAGAGRPGYASAGDGRATKARAAGR